jgi:hypothetical protein
LNDSIVDVGGHPLSPGNQYFQNQSATEYNTIETQNDNVTQQYENIMIRVDKTTPASAT